MAMYAPAKGIVAKQLCTVQSPSATPSIERAELADGAGDQG
jgi:hypothetical protein